MTAINICSLNVRGLVDSKKVFHYFNLKEYQIILLQETHSTAEIESYWKAEWGHNLFYSNGTSNSRGTAVLIKNNCAHEIHKIISDSEGI